jgi:8-oxo-dGTP pyrophosphatase MutT (NUDIX family)
MRKAVRAIIIRGDQLLVMHRNKFGHEYYTLLGGGIDPGETAEQSLVREVMEESSLQVTALRPVFIEEAGDPFGTQYIYLCEAHGEGVALHPSSEEARIHVMGQNLFAPQWVSARELAGLEFRSSKLKQAILHGIQHGFPAEPAVIDDLYIESLRASANKGGI